MFVVVIEDMFVVVIEDMGFEHAKQPEFNSIKDARKAAKLARKCGHKKVSIYSNGKKVK